MSSKAPGSLRRALALRLVLGGGLLLGCLFEALDFVIDHELYSRFDAALTERGRLLATELTGNVPPGPRTPAAWPEFRAGSHTDFFQLWDRDGVTVARSPSSGERDLARPPQAPTTDAVLYDVDLPDGHRGRAAALRVDGNASLFVIAAEREALDALERRIHVALIVTIGIVLLLVVSLSITAVHRALRPLADFGADAERRSLDPAASGYDISGLPIELQPVGAALDRSFTRLTQLLLRERRFARDLAHELRTPLAEMFSLVETLPATDPVNGARREQLAQTLTGMTRIIDGLLALARYEAGIDAPAIEPVDLATVVRAQVRALSAPAAQRRLVLETAVAGEAWVMTDELLIERIVANLIGNAISHAPEGSHIAVHCEQVASGLRFAVDNAAPDLSEADVARLGERHFRTAHASSSGGHAGLGLALCMALGERLGLTLVFNMSDGRLTVELTGLRPLDAEI